VFATSRPDLVEVDLKRQGRLDVHIPLFPPQNADEMRDLFLSVAKKFKFPLTAEEIPELPASLQLAGNEIEGTLVRALRRYELAADPKPALKDLLADALREVRPNPNTKKLEYMDLAAVKECTDQRFLPEQYRQLTMDTIDQRLAALKPFV
jgi:SpoVK/Ycf46/Vps4 family AAA+-type ATPase